MVKQYVLTVIRTEKSYGSLYGSATFWRSEATPPAKEMAVAKTQTWISIDNSGDTC